MMIFKHTKTKFIGNLRPKTNPLLLKTNLFLYLNPIATCLSIPLSHINPDVTLLLSKFHTLVYFLLILLHGYHLQD